MPGAMWRYGSYLTVRLYGVANLDFILGIYLDMFDFYLWARLELGTGALSRYHGCIHDGYIYSFVITQFLGTQSVPQLRNKM